MRDRFRRQDEIDTATRDGALRHVWLPSGVGCLRDGDAAYVLDPTQRLGAIEHMQIPLRRDDEDLIGPDLVVVVSRDEWLIGAAEAVRARFLKSIPGLREAGAGELLVDTWLRGLRKSHIDPIHYRAIPGSSVPNSGILKSRWRKAKRRGF